jgi:hypothetical protein
LTEQRPEPALAEHDPFVGFDELRQRARRSGGTRGRASSHPPLV